MSEHNSAVFNNSCLKVPRHPQNKKPYPVHDQKLINQLENQARKLSITPTKHLNTNKDKLKSLIEFYDSIPEYADVNHLSNKDFYRKLEYLKEKQRSYYDYLDNELKYETRNTGWIEDYKKLNISSDKTVTKPCIIKNDGTESIESLDKDVAAKPPSRRSVRIETPTDKLSAENTPDLEYFRSKSRIENSRDKNRKNDFFDQNYHKSKTDALDSDYSRPKSRIEDSVNISESSKSRADLSSAGSKRIKSPSNDFLLEDLSDLERECTLTTKSVPNSPRKVAWKDCGITIPKPFQMTIRDEEDKIVEDIIIKNRKPKDEKFEMFRAHPVPIESQIPLFDKIMYDQERRSQRTKQRSKQALLSQMRPFSFTKREEEIQSITKRLSKSSPSLFADDKPLKIEQFKAKPVPKNLFSNYVYRKMHEDEYYRAMQKKIRSEEMLKAASLPPAMAKREKNKPKPHICPRSYRDCYLDDEMTTRKHQNNKDAYANLDKELAELELDFIMSTPSPKRSKNRTKRKGKKSYRKTSADSVRSMSALESVNRSNLAAVLRLQTARKRMENEMSRRLESLRLKEEARWREKVLRQRPVWQALAYSHEEDLNMRLQLRRDEERLRNEEHKLRMQTMLGRVNQQPTLFERQSYAKNAKTREELISKLYKNIGRYSVSSSDSERRSVVEMKDEAIQAQFDEMFKDEERAAIEGDDEDQEKVC